MSSVPATLFVAVSPSAVFLRIRGRATARESTTFRTAVEALRARGHLEFVIDLTECQSLDSTFIGVLTGLSRRLREQVKPGHVELINLSETVHHQLDNLFVLDQFTLTQCARQPGAAYEAVAGTAPSKAELCRLMLDAHQTLMDLNPANVPRFKQVTDFLKSDLEKLT